MNTQMVTIQVAPQVAVILDTLQKRAEAQGVSLDALLLPLVALNGSEIEQPFYETATPEEWIRELYAWAESHDPNSPVILDDSREAIYGDDGR